jgi:uncharacterized protein YhfF
MKSAIETQREMWREYLAHLGEEPERSSRTYSAWHFCDNREDADALAELVLAGDKRATAGLKLAYEAEGEPLPKRGDLSLITDYDGMARCIIRTAAVEVRPFGEVSPEFAAREGEGDKSLEHWRRVHWEAFGRDFEELEGSPSEEMEVVCEDFELVWPLDVARDGTH